MLLERRRKRQRLNGEGGLLEKRKYAFLFYVIFSTSSERTRPAMTKPLAMFRYMLVYITIFSREMASLEIHKTSRFSRACFFNLQWYGHCKL